MPLVDAKNEEDEKKRDLDNGGTSSPPPPPPPNATSPPSSSSSLPPTQLSPETLRSLVMACSGEGGGGRRGGDEEGTSSSSSAAAASIAATAANEARDRLRGHLGFCFEPMSWSDAKAAIADGGVEAIGRMGRTPEGVAEYWRWRDDVCSKEYASTADFVRIEIMGFDAAVGKGKESFLFLFFRCFSSS